MTEFLVHLIQTAATAGFVVVAVLVLRLFLKKAPRWIAVALWGLVALRLICPVSVESALSIVPSVSIEQAASSSETQAMAPDIPTDSSVTTTIPDTVSQTAPPTDSPAVAPASTVSLDTVLAIVWATGVVAMWIYGIGTTWRLRRRIRTAVKEEAGIYLSDAVDSPFVLGLIRPKIYLPFTLAEPERSCVLAHERAHIRRGDHWIKPFSFIMLSLYWFQPLLWVAYWLLCRDIEAACDERVIRTYSKEERRQYSYALVSLGIHRRLITACPVAFGEVGTKERVKRVMHYKKPTVWILTAAVLITAVASVCLLTDRKVEEGATLKGASLQITTSHSASPETVALAEGGSLYVRDHTNKLFTATVKKMDDKAMAVTLSLDDPLYLDGIKTTTVTVPYDETVTLRSVEPYNGIYGTYTFKLDLPSVVDDVHFPGVETWSYSSQSHTRYEAGEMTLILADTYFTMGFGEQSDYLMTGTYAYADSTLTLTEDAHLTAYVFDMTENGDIVYNEKASYRHELAKTQSLQDGDTLGFCYRFAAEDDQYTLSNATGQAVLEGDTAAAVYLEWCGDGNVTLHTIEKNDTYVRSLQYANVKTGAVSTVQNYVIGYNSYLFASIWQEGTVCGVAVCGVNNDFGVMDVAYQPKELMRFTLDGVSSVEEAAVRVLLTGDEEIAVIYTDDNGNERIVAYNVRNHKSITRRLLVLGRGNLLNGYGGYDGGIVIDTVDIYNKGTITVYRESNNVRRVYYYDIIKAAVYLDGAYVDLKTALEDGRLTVAAFEELCKADAAAYQVEGGVDTLRDGGTTVYSYKYDDDYHFITFRHTLNGDHDVYIGKRA